MNMGDRQKLFKKTAFYPTNVDQKFQEKEGTQTLLLSDGKQMAQRSSSGDGCLALPAYDAVVPNGGSTSFPNLSENNAAKLRWLEGLDSDEEYHYLNKNMKRLPLPNEQGPRQQSAKKMLPRIGDSGRMRKSIFSDPNSLCNRIKTSCSISQFTNMRRSSYGGITEESNNQESDASKPSIQGTGLLRKPRGERAQLIDANEFSSVRDPPIHRSIEIKKPNLTPWSKTKPFIGRPQSGKTLMPKRSSSDSYASMDMACVGSKIKNDDGEMTTNIENRAQKVARKFRNMRAKSASLVEKTF